MSSARAMWNMIHAIEFRSSRGRTRICASDSPVKVRSAADILLPPTARECMAACCSRNRSRASMRPPRPPIHDTGAGGNLRALDAAGRPARSSDSQVARARAACDTPPPVTMRRRHPMAVKRPTPYQLTAVAEDLGMTFTDEDLASYSTLMAGTLAAYDAIDAMPDFLPAMPPGIRR